MRYLSIFLPAVIATCGLAQTSNPVAGRWEGTIEIPSRPFVFVIDLAPAESGNWVGSATVPGFDVKGTPLANLAVTGSQVEFAIKGVLGAPQVKAQLDGDVLKGDFTVAGNTARFTLRKIGPSQVDLPPKSTPVQHELEGPWNGSFVYAGNTMEVKLNLVNQKGAASANLILVREKDIPVTVALVRQEGSALTLESASGQIRLETTFDPASNELRGAVEIGGTGIPIVLRKGEAK
jgi:hypothetical protein